MVNETNEISYKEKLEAAFTAKAIKEMLDLGHQLINHVLKIDPDNGRALEFQRNCDKCLAPYEKLYKVLSKKQSLMTDFITKTPRSETLKNEICQNEICQNETVEMTIEPDLHLIVSSDDENDYS